MKTLITLAGFFLIILSYAFGAMILPQMDLSEIRYKAGVTLGLILTMYGSSLLAKGVRMKETTSAETQKAPQD